MSVIVVLLDEALKPKPEAGGPPGGWRRRGGGGRRRGGDERRGVGVGAARAVSARSRLLFGAEGVVVGSDVVCVVCCPHPASCAGCWGWRDGAACAIYSDQDTWRSIYLHSSVCSWCWYVESGVAWVTSRDERESTRGAPSAGGLGRRGSSGRRPWRRSRAACGLVGSHPHSQARALGGECQCASAVARRRPVSDRASCSCVLVLMRCSGFRSGAFRVGIFRAATRTIVGIGCVASNRLCCCTAIANSGFFLYLGASSPAAASVGVFAPCTAMRRHAPPCTAMHRHPAQATYHTATTDRLRPMCACARG